VRILYLADIRFPLERANGIQSMETCHALAARGHDVALVVRPDTQSPARDPYEFYGLARMPRLAIEVAPVTGPAPARRAGYLTFAIGRALRRGRQDLVFTRDLGLASLLLRVPAAFRAPVVYEAHTIASNEAAGRPAMLTGASNPSASKLRRLDARDAHVWRAAEGYVTITAGLKRELERRFGPRERVEVVPDGARTPNLQPPTSNLRPPFTIGYAGHLYPWKGVDFIIEAVAALPETRALIVGGHEQEPDLARVKALAAGLDCASRVTFTGLRPPADVAARLRECDVLVLPNPSSPLSDAFTSPLKLFEYMAAGRPIVASDLPALREVLAHETNALLFEPGNPQALTTAIRRIKEDPDFGARLARQALDDVQRYTWAARAERLEAVFNEVREVRGVLS